MKEVTIDVSVPSVDELLESLNEENRTEDVIKQLYMYYDHELNNLFRYALGASKPVVRMGVFNKAGDQYIADFSVSDLGIEKKESYNFHFQNTSQWKYAGAILVQNGEVSTHH